MEKQLNQSVYETDIRNTCVVIVTYGDRIHLLEPVVAKVGAMGVGCVVVVDNGSAPQSRTGIKKLLSWYRDQLRLIELDENRGSAGGFKAGLCRAEETGLQYIWILDDDNNPKLDALQRIFDAYRLLGSNPRNAITSARAHYSGSSETQSFSNDWRPIVPLASNSFLGFHVKDLATKLTLKICPALKKTQHSVPLEKRKCALYGGFFFHRSWLNKVGYPMEALFVDMDDIEYSSRFIEHGGSIYHCWKSIVFDTDSSWPSGNMFILPQANEARVYYSVRNRVFLGKKDISNPVVYWLNAISYLFYLFFGGVLTHRNARSFLRRIKLIFRAIQDGRKNRLGPVWK